MSLQSNSSTTVGRPREFDLDDVLRKAMHVFWDRGYHDASLPDLLGAMKLSKGSFYKAFGDKKAVFLRSLDLYSEDAARNVREVLASDASPRKAIRNAFLRYADLSSGSKGVRGCFAVLAAAEMLPGDAETSARIRAHFKRLQDLFADAIEQGQDAGEIGKNVDAQVLAHFIVAHAQGMRVLGKIGTNPDTMRASVDPIMDAFF